MVVWGGYGSVFLNSGGVYDPETDTWAAASTVGASSVRYQHTAVWTGSKMIVWGGNDNEYPFRLTSRTTVEGPRDCPDLHLETLPPATQGEFLRWTATPALERGGATLRLEATRATGTFPAARYREYFLQSEQAIRSAGRSVACTVRSPAASH